MELKRKLPSFEHVSAIPVRGTKVIMGTGPINIQKLSKKLSYRKSCVKILLDNKNYIVRNFFRKEVIL